MPSSGSKPNTRYHSSDKCKVSLPATCQTKLPVCVSLCASAKQLSLRRNTSSARLLSVISVTAPTNSGQSSSFSEGLPMTRMYSLHCEFNRNLGCRLVFEYPKGFSRPVDLSTAHIPTETPRQAQFLRFGQVSFAASQLLFRLLRSGDIHYRPNKLND